MYLVIIDNDRAYLRSLEILLAPSGFDLRCFSHPREALDWLAENGSQVSGLIVDYFMPEMNGLAVAAEARTMISPDTVVVLVSGHVERLPANGTGNWPIHAVLPKPLDLTVLTRLLPQRHVTYEASDRKAGRSQEHHLLKNGISSQGAAKAGFQQKNRRNS